nr:MAG TPA: hypothetical protein [Caudoviricetes sp.]
MPQDFAFIFFRAILRNHGYLLSILGADTGDFPESRKSGQNTAATIKSRFDQRKGVFRIVFHKIRVIPLTDHFARLRGIREVKNLPFPPVSNDDFCPLGNGGRGCKQSTCKVDVFNIDYIIHVTSIMLFFLFEIGAPETAPLEVCYSETISGFRALMFGP